MAEGVSFTFQANPPQSEREQRLRAMGEQLQGVPLTECFALVQSLVVSLIGNATTPDKAGPLHDAFVRALASRLEVTVDLAAQISLLKAESGGHA